MKFLGGKRRYWVVGLVLCAGIMAIVLAKAKDDSHVDGTFQQSDLALGRQPVYQDPIEEVSLILKADGFEPREARLHGKRFFLSVDNRTDVRQLVFRLTRMNGSQVRELHVPEGAGDWSELFDLPAGTYTLSEASHSDWTCKIAVQQRDE